MKKEISIKKLGITLVNEWKQLRKGYNWYEMTLIKIYAENDKHVGTSEIELYLLGFGIRFYWTSNKETLENKIAKWSKDLEDENFINIEGKEI